LTYIDGETVPQAPACLSDAAVVSAARLIREFHDATAGTRLAGDQEVVCHGDLGSHNIVFVKELAVGLIDWDGGVAPGLRVVDFAHAVWCCADVCEEEVDLAEQARKVRLMCDAYGGPGVAAVIDEITARFCRARDDHAAAGRVRSNAIFEAMVSWMRANGSALTSDARNPLTRRN
jgi:aminoglycoside phosphotransferase (APT) family kinase protein